MRIETASDAGTTALDLSAPCNRFGPSHDAAIDAVDASFGPTGVPRLLHLP